MTSQPSAVPRRELFGTLPDGTGIERITLRNAEGMSAAILNFGATLQALHVPDRTGTMADVTAGFPTLDGYTARPPYFGATVGRVANRIANGRFQLDGRAYQVPVNNGSNSLHGGHRGFDQLPWTVIEVSENAVELALISPDRDQGYPGELRVVALWQIDGSNRLSVEYTATTDQPTVVNLTNHAYWNLCGDGTGSALEHVLTIPADAYLPTNAGSIPTGEFRPVQETAFDFRSPVEIGARVRDAGDEQLLLARGYDHNWVISREVCAEPRMVARLADPESGRAMALYSDQPGLQFYSGNFLDGSLIGKSGRAYRMGDAIALEPQMFPDAANQAAFGSTRLDPGETYRSRIVWHFSIED